VGRADPLRQPDVLVDVGMVGAKAVKDGVNQAGGGRL
jgi:hypothetical protein